jgi:hypothetical protein
LRMGDIRGHGRCDGKQCACACGHGVLQGHARIESMSRSIFNCCFLRRRCGAGSLPAPGRVLSKAKEEYSWCLRENLPPRR